jgi:hypothetical protein
MHTTRMSVWCGSRAGILLYGRDVRWESAVPPRRDYLEDAHAREFKRPLRRPSAGKCSQHQEQVANAEREIDVPSLYFSAADALIANVYRETRHRLANSG